MIETRLSNISGNKTIFDNAKPDYEQALKKSGHNHQLNYNKKQNKNKSRNRARNIIWYNPPYNIAAKTNLGSKFLQLVQKHFPPKHRLHIIFNKNNIKLSYSCTKNIGTIIKNHNSNITNKETKEKTCNCRNKNNCPLNGECLTSNIIYKATVTTDNNTAHYIGSSETEFKTRYNNHTASFRHTNKKNATSLSTHIHKQKEQNKTPIIKWEILAKCHPYTAGTRKCDLCLSEKLHILTDKSKELLNVKGELINKCRHSAKWKLNNTQ